MTKEQASIIEDIEKIRRRIVGSQTLSPESANSARRHLDQAAFWVKTAGTPAPVEAGASTEDRVNNKMSQLSDALLGMRTEKG